MHTKLALLLVGFALFSLQTFGQNDYAVTFKGDTLKGKIKLLSFDNLDRVQINTGQKKLMYTALQVKSIYKDKLTYQPVKLENTLRFMQVFKSGYLSFYAYNVSGQNLWDGRYLQKKDGSGMEIPNLSFKKLLSKYLGDCPDVAIRVENGDFSKKDIAVVVDLYNACLQAKTEAMLKNTSTSSSTTSFSSEKILAITKLSEKVEAAENFLTKKDVMDLLKDIKGKVSSNQAVPNYLTEGLKSYLTDTPDLLKEAEDLIVLLKK